MDFEITKDTKTYTEVLASLASEMEAGQSVRLVRVDGGVFSPSAINSMRVMISRNRNQDGPKLKLVVNDARTEAFLVAVSPQAQNILDYVTNRLSSVVSGTFTEDHRAILEEVRRYIDRLESKCGILRLPTEVMCTTIEVNEALRKRTREFTKSIEYAEPADSSTTGDDGASYNGDKGDNEDRF